MARITLRQLAGSRGGARLCAAGLQHQQHGTGPGDHGGGRGRRLPGDHPGLARRAVLRQRHHAGPADRRPGRDLSQHPGVHAPGPRQRPGDLRHRDPVRLHLGDDGRLAEGGRQDPRRPTTTTSRSPARWSRWPTPAACRSRANWACLGRSRPAWARRRTATASRACSSHDQLLTDPDQAVEFVEGHRRRRPGHRHGHQPRRLQVHAQAGRRRPGHERDRGDPPAACPTPTW